MGQQINFEKSNICFSTNTKERDILLFCEALGVREVEDMDCYLGLPTQVGMSKIRVFQQVKVKVWTILNSWSSKLLSQVVNEMLIKAVA